jgi:hypothetical protein
LEFDSESRREERYDSAVGVPTEVVARPELFGDPVAMFLKVDVILDRIRWEARSVQHDEFEVGGKFVLGGPRKVTVADAPVNEN